MLRRDQDESAELPSLLRLPEEGTLAQPRGHLPKRVQQRRSAARELRRRAPIGVLWIAATIYPSVLSNPRGDPRSVRGSLAIAPKGAPGLRRVVLDADAVVEPAQAGRPRGL